MTVWRVTVGLGLGLGVVTVGRVELLLELEDELEEVLFWAMVGGVATGRRHLDGSSAQSSR